MSCVSIKIVECTWIILLSKGFSSFKEAPRVIFKVMLQGMISFNDDLFQQYDALIFRQF